MYPLTGALLLFSTIVSGDHSQRFGGRYIPGGRIIGGEDANIADYPYQLCLVYSDYGPSCGASLISPKWALTAAHCTFDTIAENITVRAGSSLSNSGGQLVNVEKILQHADFDYDTAENDIALLKLSSEVTVNTYSQIIALATSKPNASEIAVVTGWGITEDNGEFIGSETLQVIQVPIVDQEECKQIYKVQGVADTMLCAGFLSEGGKDACTGDSGGPLVVNGILAGIVSWGNGCALPDRPGVYTNVASYLDWITEKMSSEE